MGAVKLQLLLFLNFSTGWRQMISLNRHTPYFWRSGHSTHRKRRIGGLLYQSARFSEKKIPLLVGNLTIIPRYSVHSLVTKLSSEQNTSGPNYCQKLSFFILIIKNSKTFQCAESLFFQFAIQKSKDQDI